MLTKTVILRTFTIKKNIHNVIYSCELSAPINPDYSITWFFKYNYISWLGAQLIVIIITTVENGAT